MASRLVLALIKIYQNNAPRRIRASCRFEPTCSNYMCIAIEKYGLSKGLRLGSNRLIRCKVPNGGIDYP